jgi:penicillin-binding protein 1C
VLSGSPPPPNGIPGRIAFKTGTSYGYRDAWSVGFDGKYTVGVWVGRPDGAPIPGLIGREGAAPILFDAFARLGAPTPLPRPPAGVLMSSTANLPPPLRRFHSASVVGENAHTSLHILFPPDGARLDLSETDGKPDAIPLKLAGAVAPITIFVNGDLVPPQPRGSLFFTPDGPGFSRVTVIDSTGATTSVLVRIADSASDGLLLRGADAVISPASVPTACPLPPCMAHGAPAAAQ